MASKRDYYDVLGVTRNVGKDEMKKAYRKKARQYHPDVSSEHDADTRFKEVNEAYEVLSDADNRAAYDRYGHAGVNQNAGGGPAGFGGAAGFGGFSDIFEEFFGGGGGGRRQQRGPRRGSDLRYDLKISFEEAVFGIEKNVEVTRPEICDSCNGSGAKKGTQPIRCTTCNGAGEVRRVQQSILGQFVNVTACSTCNGTGELIVDACEVCNGRKQIQKTRTIRVKIPAGVDNDTQIRLTGEGGPGTQGGPPGNLFVVLHVAKHDIFRREGNDLWIDLHINVAQAALGDEIEVPTLEPDGSKSPLSIPPGTESGKVFRLRDLGVPILDRRGRGTHNGRGDMRVMVHVAIPKKLTDEQRSLFKKLGESLGKEIVPQNKQGFWSNVKDAFDDSFR